MKLVFSKKSIDDAPKTHTRIRLTDEARSVKRLVREGGLDTIEIGAGKPEEMNARKFITLCRAIVNTAREQKAKKIVLQLDRTSELFKNLQHLSAEQVSQITAENFEMANFEFRIFKTKPKEGWTDVEEILLCGKSSPAIEAAVKRGQIIGQEVNACRALANMPGGDMTPKLLAKAAKQAVTGLPVTVQTLGRAQMEKLGMGAILGVASGSPHEPTFTIMEYRGGPAKQRPIVIAGKGITFDSGGLNLKTSAGIYEMHMDMSGGAAVIHSVALAAKLKLKKNVVGLIPASENTPGANAVRPGDILKSLSGKTIEVTDTDAEGRLVLADALTYAKRFNPSVVLDVATLTGASMIALGHYASGVLSRDDKLRTQIEKLGELSGDYVWPLPLWDEYEDMVKSPFADLQNHMINGGRYGGATEGGIFLWQFAKELDCPWAHLDIAPRMTSAPGDELAKGAAGAPVRLLISFIDAWNPTS